MSPTSKVEKEGLLPSSIEHNPQQRKPRSKLKLVFDAALILGCMWTSIIALGLFDLPDSWDINSDTPNIADLCPQPSALLPSVHADLWQDLGKTFGTEEFAQRAVNWLGGAVQIP